MALRQRDAENGYVLLPQSVCQGAGRELPAAVGIGIEGQIDDSLAFAQLLKLARIEMGSQRAGEVMKTGLPQHGIVEQALDENDFGMAAGLSPCIQTTPGARQKPVRRRRGGDAAAIQIAFQREDDAMHVSVVASGGDQTGLTQSRERIAQLRQPASQAAAAGCVADPHVLNELRRAESALLQIRNRLGAAV